MRNYKFILRGFLLFIALIPALSAMGQETRDSLRMSVADTLHHTGPAYFAPFNPAFSKFLLLEAPRGPLSKEELALKANMYARKEVLSSMSWTLENTILNPMVYERQKIYTRTAAIGYLSPFSIPFGYVPVMNSSNPFAITKIPGWSPEPYRYSPDIFPQSIELEYDETSGIYRQVSVGWEDYNERIKLAKGGGKFGNNPIPAAAVTPVERSMQNLR